jgi:hypothetical protein
MEALVAAPNPPTPASPEAQGGCLSIVIRLSWIFGGIAVLIYCAVYIAMGRNPGLIDAVYWIIVAAILVLRFVDIKFLKGETLDNQPATLKHWRGYALKMLIAAGVLYALAKLIGKMGLL